MLFTLAHAELDTWVPLLLLSLSLSFLVMFFHTSLTSDAFF
jgi:hypothetical protein